MHDQKQASSLLAYSVMSRLGIGGDRQFRLLRIVHFENENMPSKNHFEQSHYEGPTSFLFHQVIHGTFSLVSFIHLV